MGEVVVHESSVHVDDDTKSVSAVGLNGVDSVDQFDRNYLLCEFERRSICSESVLL